MLAVCMFYGWPALLTFGFSGNLALYYLCWIAVIISYLSQINFFFFFFYCIRNTLLIIVNFHTASVLSASFEGDLVGISKRGSVLANGGSIGLLKTIRLAVTTVDKLPEREEMNFLRELPERLDTVDPCEQWLSCICSLLVGYLGGSPTKYTS